MSPIEVLRTDESWIQKTPGKCGGRACIRDTRVPVWSLVVARRLGVSDTALLRYFVTPLMPADIHHHHSQQSAKNAGPTGISRVARPGVMSH